MLQIRDMENRGPRVIQQKSRKWSLSLHPYHFYVWFTHTLKMEAADSSETLVQTTDVTYQKTLIFRDMM
jgi:hypothetical protein